MAIDAADAEPHTPLDSAFLRAQQDSEATAQFFDTLFAETLFLPVVDDLEEVGGMPEGRSVQPVFYDVDGATTVVVFDTEERLAQFVDEPTNYIGLPGRDLFRMFDGREQIAVNLAVAPSSVILAADNVAWLHEQATAAAAVHEVNPGSTLRLEHPGAVAPAALAALTSCLAGLRDAVEDAVLVRISVEEGGPPDQARLVLAMAPTEAGKDRADEVAQSVAEAAAPLAGGGEAVEVSVFDGDGALMSKARAVGLPLPIKDIGAAH